MTLPDSDECYERFVFAATDDDPTGWGLSYQALDDTLRRIDPQSPIDRGPMAMKDDELFWYQVTFPFGWAEGNAGVRHNWISIADTTIDKAAHFASWLRREIVPRGAGIAFNFFEGIQEGASPGTLPDTDDVDTIKAVLEEFVRGVLDEEA